MVAGREGLLEIIVNGAIYAAEEMGVVLRNTSYSPNIKDRLDFSCAVIDPRGNLVAQAEHIPVHLGSMAVGARNALREMGRLGMDMGEGDVIIVNDPYIAGTHLNDIMLLKPLFDRGGGLVAILANKAHHVDVGGTVRGSVGGEVEELVQEGINLPLLKLVESGRLNRDIVRILENNVRTPDYVRGDLKAQIASLNTGERRLGELLGKYGPDALLEAWRWALDYTEKYTRRVLEEAGHGTAEAVDYMEMPREGLVRIKARVTISPGGAHVDFTGTSPQVEAPLNAVYGVTVAASLFALKSVLDPEMPMNHGFERLVRIEAPPGTLVNPRRPAPVSAGNTETSQRIADVVLRALADILPGRVPAASTGSMNNLTVGGVHEGRSWAFYETIGGGSGGRPGMDGVDGIHTNMTNTLNTPIEVLEKEYPILFTRYSLRPDSEGPGTYRGGLGLVRAFRALVDGVVVTITGERVLTRPYGLAGGRPGEPARYVVRRARGGEEVLPSKATVRLERGDEVVIMTAGGGGYGDPCRRPRELVERDLREARVTRGRAAREYCYEG